MSRYVVCKNNEGVFEIHRRDFLSKGLKQPYFKTFKSVDTACAEMFYLESLLDGVIF